MKILKYMGTIILLMGVAWISALIPYQRIFYMMQKTVSIEKQNAVVGDITYEGLNAGQSVPTIQKVEDIISGMYFTIETDELEPTDMFCLIDISHAGTKRVGTRMHRSTRYMPYWTENKMTVSLNDMEYARFYIAKLPDGNRVIILIDDTLVQTNRGKKIRLPVGIKASPYQVTQTEKTFDQYFMENYSKFGLEEGTDWYVNMASKSFHNKYRLPVMILRFIGGIIMVVIFYSTIEKAIKLVRKNKN